MERHDQLLARAADDPQMFSPLVEAFGPDIWKYLARRCPDAADDLLSDVWLQAFAARATYRVSRGSARGWFFGIARNVLFSHFRREAGPKRQIAGNQDALTDIWAAVDDRLVASAAAPALRAALEGLPAGEREVVLLAAWEQLSPSESGQVLGIPAGTVRSRLHRARTRLREHLSENHPVHKRVPVVAQQLAKG